MAQQQLVRTYDKGDMPQAYTRDAQELAQKGWQVHQQQPLGAQRTRVIYWRDETYTPAVATPDGISPLPAALAPLPAEVHDYTQNEVLVLVIGYVAAATVLIASGAQSPFWIIAGGIFALTSVYAVLRDGFGVGSMRGQLPWQNLTAIMKFILVSLEFVLSPIVMPYYAGLVVWQRVLRRKVVSPRRIAQLEARLGIMPVTVGECRNCGKPIQAGAEFCSYCGETVIEYPRICPKCSTVNLPDAQFCLKCRTPLTA